MRKGAFKAVSFSSQFFSIPLVTDKKTMTNHTTKDITTTEINEIKVVDRDRFFGIKYLSAMKSSNIKGLILPL